MSDAIYQKIYTKEDVELIIRQERNRERDMLHKGYMAQVQKMAELSNKELNGAKACIAALEASEKNLTKLNEEKNVQLSKLEHKIVELQEEIARLNGAKDFMKALGEVADG